MSLANLTSPFGTPGQDPNAPVVGFDPTKIAQQAQTDPSVRMMFAQMFADPASRHFVQDSGNVVDAMARPDNPWSPGTSIVAQPPAATEPGAPGAGAGSSSQIGPPYSSASFGTGTPSPAGTSPYADAHQYAMDNPSAAAIPGRPVDPMANVHGARKALLMAFLGLNKFGAGLAHQQGSFADEFLGNEMQAQGEQRRYDANLPLLKTQAENAAYNTYLGQTAQEAGIEHTAAETRNLQANVPMLQRQQAFIDKARTLKESGKYATDQDLLNALLPEARTIPGMSMQMLNDAVDSTKVLGSKYTLSRDPQTEQPIELTDRQGDKYSASNLPNDPEARQMWNDALTAASSKETTEENKEKRVAGYAADRQAQAFENAQKTEGQKQATTHLADIRDAANQQQLMQDLLSGKKDPAGQTAAMFKMIGLEQPTGTHRIMPAEIEGVEHLGGLSDKLKQTLLGWKQGDKFSPDLVPDVIATAKTLTDNKIKQANDNLEDVHRTYGYKVTGSDANGRLDGRPSLYGVGAQPAAAAGGGGGEVTVTDPSGGVHTFPNQAAADAFKKLAGIQ
jgi:hypothetical protein